MIVIRYHILRFDIWLCLALSVLLAFGAGKIANKILPEKYEEHKAEHIVDAGDIGGIADDSIFRAQNIDDLLSHNTFTVISPGIEYRNKGAGYYKGMYLQQLTLPSGEMVAARINSDSVVNDGEYYSGNSTLPVGRIIEADLTEEQTFLETPVMIIQLVTVLITFPIFHHIGAKLGIFPHILPQKKKKEENEWD